jgi:hypothetical protein
MPLVYGRRKYEQCVSSYLREAVGGGGCGFILDLREEGWRCGDGAMYGSWKNEGKKGESDIKQVTK